MVNIQKNIFSMIMNKLLKSNYVIIDTETTGLGAHAEIIEIAIINMRGEVLLDTMVKPVRAIPPDVTEINHITNEMVANAPAWCDVFPKVLAIISSQKWLAWNSGFDARMMEQTCLSTGFFNNKDAFYGVATASLIHTSHIDAKEIYDQWYGEFDEKRKAFKYQSLSTAAARHGVSADGAHRALADCKMVLAVLESAPPFLMPKKTYRPAHSVTAHPRCSPITLTGFSANPFTSLYILAMTTFMLVLLSSVMSVAHRVKK